MSTNKELRAAEIKADLEDSNLKLLKEHSYLGLVGIRTKPK